MLDLLVQRRRDKAAASKEAELFAADLQAALLRRGEVHKFGSEALIRPPQSIQKKHRPLSALRQRPPAE
ncbi:MAG TPA: hypothetical protein VKA12_07375 [Roseiarcus sp.]|nr:hypothetical protein [Roseiarcus sp.]